MPATPPAARDLFLEAIRLPPEDWPGFVQARCAGDSDLRQLLEGLLQAHLDATGPAADPGETAGYPTELDAEGPWTAVGPYKLLERVGEGGMGVVYVAEQSEPVRRRVALKMIKPGMDSRAVVARFEQERQALALMDHPHIARVFDGGTTPAGRPYFVMELVRGLPVTDYCDQARLPAADRLRLFALVCRAVQHAHQKGVIHRDLKPSNILVTVVDGQPVPKVIDFGIAKAVGQSLTDKTVYTALHHLVGTPIYMSPEQAELSGVDVDTRADVYALGVLLYELLTGTTPFDRETFRRASLDEVRRIIRQDEPPRPSARVSTLDAKAATTSSARRGVDRRQLGRLLRGDLDWMVMTALEKDRGRRYEGAGAFAADVERFLADEPVQARPPSAAYRLRKFARRHRIGVVVGGFAAVALAVLAGGVGYMVRDGAARKAAAGQRAAEALAGARTAIEVGDLALAGRRTAEADGHLGADRVWLPEMVHAVEQVLREVEARQADEARIQRFIKLANSAQDKMSFTRSPDGQKDAEEALGLYGVLTDDDWLAGLEGMYLTATQQHQVRETAYITLVTLADFQVRWEWQVKDPLAATRALSLLRRADAFHRPTRAFYFIRSVCHRYFLQDSSTADQDWQRYLQAPAESAWDYYMPGHTAGWEGDIDEAIRAYWSALTVQPNHWNSLYFLANRLHIHTRQYSEAVGLYTACIALRPNYDWVWSLRAECQERLGNLQAAAAGFNAVVDRAKSDEVRFENLLYRARFFERQGEPAAATSDFAAMARLAKSDDDRVTLFRNRALFHERLGDRAAATADFTAVVDVAKTDDDRSVALQNRAQFYERQDHRKAAEADFTALVKLAKSGPNRIDALLKRADFFDRQGDRKAAEADFTAAVEHARTDEGRVPVLALRAFFFTRAGRTAEAAADYRQMFECQSRLVEHATGTTRAEHLSKRALHHCWLGHYERAVEDCTRAIELAPGNGHHWNTLGVVKVVSGDVAGAREAARKVLELSPNDLESWCTQAGVFLLAGDDTSYHRMYEIVLARHSKTKNARWAYLVARMGTLTPASVADSTRFVPLAQFAADADRFDRESNRPTRGMAHHIHTLGMAYYRVGQFDQAIEQFSQVAEHHSDWDGTICNWLALVLAHHRLGHAAEARQWLDKAVRWIANPTAMKLWQTEPFRELHTHNWVAYRLLLKEAEEAVNGVVGKR